MEDKRKGLLMHQENVRRRRVRDEERLKMQKSAENRNAGAVLQARLCEHRCISNLQPHTARLARSIESLNVVVFNAGSSIAALRSSRHDSRVRWLGDLSSARWRTG